MINPNDDNHAEEQDNFEYQTQEGVLGAEDGLDQVIEEDNTESAVNVGREMEGEDAYLNAEADEERLMEADRASQPSYELHLDDDDVNQPE